MKIGTMGVLGFIFTGLFVKQSVHIVTLILTSAPM